MGVLFEHIVVPTRWCRFDCVNFVKHITIITYIDMTILVFGDFYLFVSDILSRVRVYFVLQNYMATGILLQIRRGVVAYHDV